MGVRLYILTGISPSLASTNTVLWVEESCFEVAAGAVVTHFEGDVLAFSNEGLTTARVENECDERQIVQGLAFGD